MKFNPSKMAFGRHETFLLRYGWLSKGFQAVARWDRAGESLFTSDEATVILGVGKNMVASMRYWLRACRMIEPDSDKPTELGIKLLGVQGFDPYLEDEATLWLLHWLLATNSELATSWYWFFNRYHKPEFTGSEMATALLDFVNDQVHQKKKPSASTIKNDAALIPRMYTQSKGNTRTPLEEALDSPFSLLKLVSQSTGGRSFQSRPQARPGLPVSILGYTVAQMFDMRGVIALPVEDLMYSQDDHPAPGSVFRLTELDLVTKLEKLVCEMPGAFEMRDTAGQHQIYKVGDFEAFELIQNHYASVSKGKAA